MKMYSVRQVTWARGKAVSFNKAMVLAESVEQAREIYVKQFGDVYEIEIFDAGTIYTY